MVTDVQLGVPIRAGSMATAVSIVRPPIGYTCNKVTDLPALDSLSLSNPPKAVSEAHIPDQRAPVELLAEFISAVMGGEFRRGRELCEQVILFEPGTDRISICVPSRTSTA